MILNLLIVCKYIWKFWKCMILFYLTYTLSYLLPPFCEKVQRSNNDKKEGISWSGTVSKGFWEQASN